jgi:hypothetical protein
MGACIGAAETGAAVWSAAAGAAEVSGAETGVGAVTGGGDDGAEPWDFLYATAAPMTTTAAMIAMTTGEKLRGATGCWEDLLTCATFTGLVSAMQAAHNRAR